MHACIFRVIGRRHLEVKAVGDIGAKPALCASGRFSSREFRPVVVSES